MFIYKWILFDVTKVSNRLSNQDERSLCSDWSIARSDLRNLCAYTDLPTSGTASPTSPTTPHRPTSSNRQSITVRTPGRVDVASDVRDVAKQMRALGAVRASPRTSGQSVSGRKKWRMSTWISTTWYRDYWKVRDLRRGGRCEKRGRSRGCSPAATPAAARNAPRARRRGGPRRTRSRGSRDTQLFLERDALAPRCARARACVMCQVHTHTVSSRIVPRLGLRFADPEPLRESASVSTASLRDFLSVDRIKRTKAGEISISDPLAPSRASRLAVIAAAIREKFKGPFIVSLSFVPSSATFIFLSLFISLSLYLFLSISILFILHLSNSLSRSHSFAHLHHYTCQYISVSLAI